MSKIIQELNKARMTRKVPDFNPGDTVVVQVKVVEGDRERVQAYEGVVIAKSNRGLNSSFTVRKISHGEGVERVFQTHSPAISDVTRQAPRQRAPRQAVLPARPVGQGGAHRGEGLERALPATAGQEEAHVMTPRSFVHRSVARPRRAAQGAAPASLLLVHLRVDLRRCCAAACRRCPARPHWCSRPRARSSSSSPATRASARFRRRCGRERAADAAVGPHRCDPRRRHRQAHPGRWCSTWTSSRAPTQPTLEELAAAIREFRATGKKVIAYGVELTQERYYLAAQADEIYLDPMGFVLVQGYDRYRTYFKDALDKLGVDINVFRVGHLQERGGDLHPHRHVPGGSRGEPRLPHGAVEQLPGSGHARAQARRPMRSRSTSTLSCRQCRRPRATPPRWRSARAWSPA